MITGNVIVIILAFSAVISSERVVPEIVSLHIQSDIKYRFATTLVTSTVVNNENRSVEASFEVTLPDAAFITEFVMLINGTLYPGEINEKVKAKKKYEAAKKKGQSAGHVSQKPRHTNRFSVDVNVAAESKITFNMTYQELLERVYGEYEHIIYIDPGQIVDDFRIDVAIQESREITKVLVPPLRNDLHIEANIEEGTNALVSIERPTTKSALIRYAPTANDQRKQSEQGMSGLFVVEYDVERKYDAGDVLVVDGYFVHFFAPDGMKALPKDLIFILDVSGSMSGRKIKQQQDAMDKILQDLKPEDRFNILQFSSGAKFWKQSLVKANISNIESARKFAQQMQASGSTRANNALTKAVNSLNSVEYDSKRFKMLVFLTDGIASSPRNEILNNVKNLNTKGLTIFSLAFGDDADYTFIKKLALNNKGIARRIFEDSDASLQIKGFYDEISSSTLQNVTFQYLDEEEETVENVTQLNFGTFFGGKEIVIAGKLSDEDVKTVSLVVTGNGADGHIELTLESDVGTIVPELTRPGDFKEITERIWAYLTIKQLLEKAIGSENAEEKKVLNEKALELSLKYKFVTPLTSMVVTKPDVDDVGSFEENEDASLALADKAASASSTVLQALRGPSPAGFAKGRPYSAGASADPHFMVWVKGLDLPICFHIQTKKDEVLQLLKDPIAGVTINAGIIASTAKNMYGVYKTFIGQLVLLAPSVHIVVKPHDILFNGAALSWEDTHPFKMLGVKVSIKKNGRHDRTMIVDFGNNIMVKIRRRMKNKTRMAVSYLNINIENDTGISDSASGILGQLVHEHIKLLKVTTDSEGTNHGHFLEHGRENTYRFDTVLDEKPVTLTGRKIKCWNAQKLVKGLFEKDFHNSFIKDINV